jgi:hypothetical protein
MRKAWSVLPILFCSLFLAAQTNQAATAVHSTKVKQGDRVIVAVKVNPAPNVAGTLGISVAPEGDNSAAITYGVGLAPGQSHSGEAGIPIPANGKIGQWKVIQVSFAPTNSPSQNLTISGNLRFEVVKRDTVLPTNADVEVK